jgi:hypothetical protein
MTADSQEKTCKTCRFHSCEQRERPVDVALDSVVEFGDPEPFYTCRAPAGPHRDQEIGFEPVYCDAYEVVQARSTSHADELMARFAARLPSDPDLV